MNKCFIFHCLQIKIGSGRKFREFGKRHVMGKIQQRVLPRILTCVPFSATIGAGARGGHHIITAQNYKLFPNQPKTKSRLKLCFIKKTCFSVK